MGWFDWGGIEWGYSSLWLWGIFGGLIGGATALLMRLRKQVRQYTLMGLILLHVTTISIAYLAGAWNSIAPISFLVTCALATMAVVAIGVTSLK